MKGKGLHMVTFLLVIIGALNWGLVGLFEWNLVAAILGSVPWLTRLVYILVGVSGVLLVATHKKDCTTCGVSHGTGVNPSAKPQQNV